MAGLPARWVIATGRAAGTPLRGLAVTPRDPGGAPAATGSTAEISAMAKAATMVNQQIPCPSDLR